MKPPAPQVSIGLVIWNGRKFLPACLASVLAQTANDFEIIIIDNGSTDDSAEYLAKNYPQLEVIRNKKNLGFAAGHNQAIALSKGQYYLALNQDTVLEPDYLAKLVDFMLKNPKTGSVQGKMKRLTNGAKTNTIDSLGLLLHRSGQVTDLGEVEEDKGQYSQLLEVFGVAGTMPLYRRVALDGAALNDKTVQPEFFDSDFFAYKEDIDLAWRLRLAGWTSYCVPGAVAYHNRSARGEGAAAHGNLAIAQQRQFKSKLSCRLSFSNHHFVYLKNLPCSIYRRIWPAFSWYEIKMWGYALIREPFLLPAMGKVFRLGPRMLRKRRQIMAQRKIEPQELLKWFV